MSVAQLTAALAGRYRVDREIGRGGMATVYLAHDLKHGRAVAIKVLREELAGAIGAERFLREIKTLAQLTHPHILPLHDSGDADGFLYYVMPFVEGETLRDRLARERQLPIADCVRIAREIADALGYAHARGFVHRDIKPANVLLESGHAVVADFGIARVVNTTAGAGLTTTGVMIGTPTYMSPEQILGAAEVDGRCDQYALACVVYEMLAGQPPFGGPSQQNLVQQHLSVPARPVASIRDGIPSGITAALQRALAKTPQERFASAEDFANALGTGTEANAVSGAVARRWPMTTRMIAATAVLIVAVAAFAVNRLSNTSGTGGDARFPRTALAVLPLQNLSADSTHAYFAMGLHDELLTQLAKVSSLSVRGRASVLDYSTSEKPADNIATELRVGALVSGSVEVRGNSLRVRVQLVDAATNELLWGDTYDRTLDDAFAIQSEVAQRIVAAVGVAAAGTERQTLAAAPTSNPEAYRLYLQGRQYWYRPGRLRANQVIAQQFFEKAVKLDSAFALAHASLSAVHGVMHWYGYDNAAQRIAAQVAEAQTALRLAPDAPEAHFAMGLADFWGRRDYERALHEFATALSGAPNNAEVWAFTGYVHRRQGRWSEVEAAYEKAIERDPRDANLFYNLGGQSFDRLHRYGDALRAYDRAIEIAPDLTLARLLRAWALMRQRGTLDSVRAVLAPLPSGEEVSDYGNAGELRVEMYLLARQPDSALREIVSASVRDEPDSPAPASTGQALRRRIALHRAWAHRMKGDTAAARADFEAIRARSEATLKRFPRNTIVHGNLGMALAGLGLRDAALREAQWMQGDSARVNDQYSAFVVNHNRAMILAQAGAADSAIAELERLLVMPSTVTTHTLRLDPVWDPIRDDPRFKALLRKYAPR